MMLLVQVWPLLTIYDLIDQHRNMAHEYDKQ
jgi:hypothetical protein